MGSGFAATANAARLRISFVLSSDGKAGFAVVFMGFVVSLMVVGSGLDRRAYVPSSMGRA